MPSEQEIAALLAEHRFTVGGCFCGWDLDRNAPMMPTYEAHVASVIAAHIGAPDDRAEWEKKLIPNDEPSGLTSREVVELVNGSIDRHCAHHCKAEAATARVRAAQAQAWDEGATHADRSWQHSEYNNSDDPTGPNFWETDTSANPYRTEKTTNGH